MTIPGVLFSLIDVSVLLLLPLAFHPPIIIGIIATRCSRRIDRSNDNLMTTLVRLTGASLIFICAFLVGSLWAQTALYSDGWSIEYRATQEVVRAVEQPGSPPPRASTRPRRPT